MTAIEFVMTFLLNAVWQPVLIVLATIAATRLLRRVSASHQYRLWIAAVVLSLALPMATSLWSSWPAFFGSRVTPVVSRETAVSERLSSLIAGSLPEDGAAVSRLPLTLPFWLAVTIFVAYTLLIAYRSTELLRAWMRSRAIAHGAQPADLSKNINEIVEQCSSALGEEPPRILFSEEIPVPVTIGSRRPTVILPKQFLRETDRDVLLTAVGHEMVHISRRDFLVNLILEIICVPLSFHPAILYARRRVSHMRELCCDETVATRLLNAEAYVRSLLNIAGSAANIRRLSPIITVGITDAENLEVRIMSLLKRSELSFNKKILLAVVALLLLAIPLVAAAYFSPEVSVNFAGIRPEAKPTETLTEKKEAGTANEGRERLERKLVEVRRAIEDPNVPEEKKASLRELQEKLVRELEETPDAVTTRQKLERTLEELRAAQSDPSLSAERRNEYSAKQAKIERELAESRDIGVGEESVREQINRAVAEKLEKEKLASMARIPMDQAIAIAQAAHPGKLVEKGIFLRGDEIAYRIFIRETPEPADGSITVVIVSGIDGRIIKTEKTFEREEPK